jgi:hypothetical protein
MNPARAARFEELALPAANKKNLGVILMKVTGQDRLMVEFLRANVASARAFAAPLPPAEMERLRQLLAGRKVVLEDFFAHHHDGFPV